MATQSTQPTTQSTQPPHDIEEEEVEHADDLGRMSCPVCERTFKNAQGVVQHRRTARDADCRTSIPAAVQAAVSTVTTASMTVAQTAAAESAAVAVSSAPAVSTTATGLAEASILSVPTVSRTADVSAVAAVPRALAVSTAQSVLEMSAGMPVMALRAERTSPTVPTSQASPIDYQRLYIDSLLDRIVSLENQVDKQSAIIMGLINKPVQQQPPSQLPYTIPVAVTPTSDANHPTAVNKPAIPVAATQKSSGQKHGGTQKPPTSNTPTETTQSSQPPNTSSMRKEVIILGDSMVKGVNGFKTSRTNFHATVQAVSGAFY